MSGSTFDIGSMLSAIDPAYTGLAGSMGTVAAPGLGSMLAVANPGMTGMAALPDSAFNASQPFTGGSGGTNWQGLAAGMKDLAGGLKGAQQQQQATQQKLGQLQQAQASPGQPRAPVSLDALVRLLQQRQQMYQQAAMSPGAKPVAPQTVQGLLGF